MGQEEYSLSEDEKQFYTALGQAITKWAEIDESLFYFVWKILGCTREQAAIVYYKHQTLGARIGLTTELMSTFFPERPKGGKEHPGIKAWRDIAGDLTDALSTRNHLAHHPVHLIVEFTESPAGEVDSIGKMWLASQISEAERLKKRSEFEPLGLPEISRHLMQVSNYVELLRGFRVREFGARLQSLVEQRGPHTPEQSR